ncbi:MAG TPA: hypothetical protein DDY31_12845 [Lachnospiraceae bacterium]|nr:hypothetical protein [Lachnospiraceae bacterium]
MYCVGCGQKLPDNIRFCPKCGKEVKMQGEQAATAEGLLEETGVIVRKQEEVPQKSRKKKWLWVIPVAGVLVVVAAAIAVFVSRIMQPSQKEVLEAYQEFYHTFYDEHMGIDGKNELKDSEGDVIADAKEIQQLDCGARIVMASDGELLLAVSDLVYGDGKGACDVYLYSYERGKVIEKARILDTFTDECFGFFTICGETYFVYDDWRGYTSEMKDRPADFLNSIFVIYKYNTKTEDLERVNWKQKGIVKKENNDDSAYLAEALYNYETEDGISWERFLLLAFGGWNEYGIDGIEGYGDDSGVNMLLNYLCLINGNDFDAVIGKMKETDVKTPEEVQMLQGKEGFKLLEKKLIDDSTDYAMAESPIIMMTETDDAYYGITLDGTAILWYIKDKKRTDISALLKSAGKYKVTGINTLCLDGCEKITDIKIPDNIVYIFGSGLSHAESLQKIEFSDSVKKIKEYNVAYKRASSEECIIPESVIVFCNKGSVAESYAIENDLFYVNGTIASTDKAKIKRIKEEMRQRELEKENADSDSYDDDSDYDAGNENDGLDDDYYDDGYDDYSDDEYDGDGSDDGSIDYDDENFSYNTPEEAYTDYLGIFTEAVNTGDTADMVLVLNGKCYDQQCDIAENYYNRGIREEVQSYSIESNKVVNDTCVKITAKEKIKVSYSDGSSKIVDQKFCYTCKLLSHKWYITAMKSK